MEIGLVELDVEKLKTPEGVNELNGILKRLSDSIANGDGADVSVVRGQITTSSLTYDMSALIPAGYTTGNSYIIASLAGAVGAHGYSDSMNSHYCYMNNWTCHAAKAVILNQVDTDVDYLIIGVK